MTKVTLDDSGGVYRIKIEGHATGNQDVCAAVSCLACTLAGYLDLHEEIRDYVDVQEGRAEFAFRSETLYEVIATGMEMLCESYPEYIFLLYGGYADPKEYAM